MVGAVCVLSHATTHQWAMDHPKIDHPKYCAKDRLADSSKAIIKAADVPNREKQTIATIDHKQK